MPPAASLRRWRGVKDEAWTVLTGVRFPGRAPSLLAHRGPTAMPRRAARLQGWQAMRARFGSGVAWR